MLRKTEGRRIRGQQRIRWLDSITDSMDVNLSKLWEMMEDRMPGSGLISGFPSSSKMLGSYFGHHPYKKGVTECKYINETYNEQTQEPFPDAHNTQRLFFFSFPCFS